MIHRRRSFAEINEAHEALAQLTQQRQDERDAQRLLITQHRRGNPDAITLMVALFGGEQQ